DLNRGALRECDDGRTASQCFDHHHAERFLPEDRHQESSGVGEELVLLGTTDLTGVSHSVVIEVWFYFFFKVGSFPRLNRPGNHQRDVRALRGRDSAVCTLGVVTAADPQYT